LFVGNIIVTALWKVFADRTREPKVVAFGQRLVMVTDFAFTGVGVILVISTGMIMASKAYGSFMDVLWIRWGLYLFIFSGVLWAAALIPIQMMQAKLAKEFKDGGEIPDRYWKLGRLWNMIGIVATIIPIIAIYIMVTRPV